MAFLFISKYIESYPFFTTQKFQKEEEIFGERGGAGEGEAMIGVLKVEEEEYKPRQII